MQHLFLSQIFFNIYKLMPYYNMLCILINLFNLIIDLSKDYSNKIFLFKLYLRILC